MNFITFFESISFKKLFGLTIALALCLAIPISVWVAQKPTNITKKAYFEKPTPPVKQFGRPSAGEPQITLVWPFLGKTGDAVLITGINFGNNPQAKTLYLDNLPVTENEIVRWTPDLIEFKIPASAPSIVFETISLSVTGRNAYWRYPFTVYDQTTKIQAVESGRILKIINPPAGGELEIFFSDGTKIDSTHLTGVTIPEGKTVISLVIRDNGELPISFFVEPDEFGF